MVSANVGPEHDHSAPVSIYSFTSSSSQKFKQQGRKKMEAEAGRGRFLLEACLSQDDEENAGHVLSRTGIWASDVNLFT